MKILLHLRYDNYKTTIYMKKIKPYSEPTVELTLFRMKSLLCTSLDSVTEVDDAFEEINS